MTRLTDAQLRVITTLSGHLLVDAGAGSGKTTTVVQALCYQLGVPVLVNGTPLPPVPAPLALDDIAAITFTNQAAADLKRKLRAALRAAGRTDLASEVDSARIGTIHGFCSDLLNGFALRAQGRPSRRVLEEGEGQSLAADCARDALLYAVQYGGVAGLDDLLSGRRLKDIRLWVQKAADDGARLAKWAEHRASLRPHEHALLHIATHAAQLRAQRLDDEGALDFDRMIGAASELLKNVPVRHAVQRRIRLLILDEFQDVDPVQRDIAYLLGGIAEADPSPTRLILVGDPKQSIYGFRRADVTLWNSVAHRFQKGLGELLPLTENFRSKAAILAMVDAAVGPMLDAPVAGGSVAARKPYEVPYAPLVARADGWEGDHAVEFIVVPAGEDNKARKVAEVRALDAVAVARRIVQLRDAGTPVGGMAILLAGWADVELYEKALRHAGIPVYVLRGEGFWEQREVLDCLLALRAIRDVADEVALVGFLKSPFVGVRDDTLLALARAGGNGDMFAAMQTVECERGLLDDAVSMLQRYGALRDRLSMHALLTHLLEESGYMAFLAMNTAQGPQQIANLRKLVRLTAAAPDQSLGEFLRTVAEEREREDRVAPERLYRERADVVTITSIHSSKGLEWPVVFWCDLVRELSGEKGKFLVGRDAFCVKDEALLDAEGKPLDPAFEALSEELALEKRAESYRLWYVASTRAKQRLVLTGIPLGTMSKGAASPARALRERFPTLGATPELEYKSHDGVVYHAVVTQAGDAAIQFAPALDAEPMMTLPPAPVTVPSGSTRLSATQLMTFSKDPALWYRRYVERGDVESREAVARAGGGSIATGLVVHAVLEQLDAGGVDVAELIERAIGAQDADAPDQESAGASAYRAMVRERVDAARNATLWQKVAGAPGARRELAFTRLMPDGSVVVGALDLAARVGDAVQVVDVKTTDVSAAELAARYAVQADVYIDAVQAIAGVRDVQFSLLTVPAGETVAVTQSSDVAGMIARLRKGGG